MSWGSEQTAKAGLAAGYGTFSGRTVTPQGSSRALRGSISRNRRRLAIVLALAITAGASVTLVPAPQSSPSVPGPSIRHAEAVALPALASISEQIGAHDRGYWGRTHGAGMIAQTSGGGLHSLFGRSGVQIRSVDVEVSASLRGIGYGDALQTVPSAAPRLDANRVLYHHPGVLEWYANGPAGLEQGFTVKARPRGSGGQPLTLSVMMIGAGMSMTGARNSELRLGSGRGSLVYGGVSASDASGRPLRAWLAPTRGGVLLRVDTTGARYPVRIDPLFQQTKLIAEGESRYETKGSLSISADGNTILAGGRWIFTRSGEKWNLQSELPESGGTGTLSPDGNTALVAKWVPPSTEGAVWVYARTGNTWIRQQLTGPSPALYRASVALSADGTTALIGALGGGPEHRGEAFVFTRSGETWTQQGEPILPTGSSAAEGASFGEHVALDFSGDTALISDRRGDVVYTRSGETWSQQGEPFAEGAPAVALSADGSTALIAGGDEGPALPVEVLQRTGEEWHLQAKLERPEYERLGMAIALSGDGDTALVGSASRTLQFTRSGETWTPVAEPVTGFAVEFSPSELALSEDGQTALWGTTDDPEGWVLETGPPLIGPEIGRCVSESNSGGAKDGHGWFKKSNCGEVKYIGSFEWLQKAEKGGFTVSASAPKLQAAGGSLISCKSGSGAGEWDGRNTVGGVSLSLLGCALNGQACTSSGHASGTIAASMLEGTLGVITGTAGSRTAKAGLALYPLGKSGPFAEFTCGSTSVVLRGGAISPVKAGVMGTKAQLKFAESQSIQQPRSFAGGEPDVLEGSFNGGAFEAIGLKMKGTATYQEKLEVNTVW